MWYGIGAINEDVWISVCRLTRNRFDGQINHSNENWLSAEMRSADRTVKASGVTSTGARNIPLKTNGAGTGTEFGCKRSGSGWHKAAVIRLSSLRPLRVHVFQRTVYSLVLETLRVATKELFSKNNS